MGPDRRRRKPAPRPALEARVGAEHADVSGLARQQRAQVVPVPQIVVAHYHQVAALIDIRPVRRLARLALDERASTRETFGVEERGPVVDHVDSPAELSARPDKRNGVVTGSAHDETEWGSQNLDEHPRLTSWRTELDVTGDPVGERARRLICGAIRQAIVCE